jgi:hypothetical protein
MQKSYHFIRRGDQKMDKIVKRKRMMFAYLSLVLASFVLVFLPHTEAFAAYRAVANTQYKSSYTSASFVYRSGGLGIKVYCANSQAKSQTMYLQRKISGSWVTRGTRTVSCSRGTEGVKMKYNYYYISNTVSGQTYRLKFVNSNASTTTGLLAEVNPS